MVRCCAIVHCENSRKGSGSNVFRFPKDTLRRQLWMNSVGSKIRNVDLTSDNFGICRVHFKTHDFINPEAKKIKLTFDAVPVLNEDNVPTQSGNTVGCTTPEEPIGLTDIYKSRIANLQQTVDNQRRLIERRDSTIAELTRKLESISGELETSRIELQQAKKEVDHLSFFRDYMTKTYSPAQLKYIKLGNVRSWPPIDVANAIGVYSASSRGYYYLRNILKYPLPSKRTLFRWLSRINITPGVLEPVLGMMKAMFQEAPSITRVCMLGYDEMSIDPRYCYDASQDRIFGVEKLLSGLFVRGLFTKWKQLIHYNFGEKLTYQELTELIKKLHDIDCDVRGIVSDLGPKNVGLLKDMNVCKVRKGEFISKTSITHPGTGNRIWIFGDFCHLLKLLRNHLIDDGLTLPDGVVIDIKLIEALIAAQKSELRLTKVTYKHIYSRGKQRQRVRPAFELFSKKVAKAILAFFPSKTSEASFFEKVNDFSDLMNVRTAEKNQNPYKSPYGMALEQQERFICEFYHYFSKIRFGNKNEGSYLPFQKSILASIRSLLGLYEDMTQDLRMRYIMTAKLNTDYIENTWGIRRGIGQFNLNPHAAEATLRIRKVIIGRNFHHSNFMNNEVEDHESLLSSEILQILASSLSVQPPEDEFISESSTKLLEAASDVSCEVSEDGTDLQNIGINNICEEGGIEFVAGFIASKLLDKHPYLKRPLNKQSPETALWIRKISDGSLTEPSTLWIAQFKKFEEIFNILHPFNSVSKKPGVTKILCSALTKKFPDIPEDLIKYYTRVRTFIRISALNREQESQKFKGQEEYHRWNTGTGSTPQPEFILLNQEVKMLLNAEQEEPVSIEDENRNEFSLEDTSWTRRVQT